MNLPQQILPPGLGEAINDIYPQLRGELRPHQPTESESAGVRFLFTAASGELYFLKEKSYYLEDRTYAWHLEHQMRLFSAGAPVEEIITARGGAPCFAYQERFMRLSRWIGAATYPLPIAAWGHRLGNSLALIHRLGAEGLGAPHSCSAPIPHRAFPRSDAGWRDLLNRLGGTTDATGASSPWPEIYAATLGFWEQVRDYDRDNTVIHGDPGLLNVLRNAEDEIRWVDFEDARLGHSLWDLAWFCAVSGFYLRTSLNGPREIISRPRWAFIRATLTGYRCRASGDLDAARFPDYLQLALIASADNWYDRDALRREPLKFAKLASRLDGSRKLIEAFRSGLTDLLK